MVFADISLRKAQGIEKFRLGLRHGLFDFRFTDEETVELRVVEFLGILQNRRVAVLLHVGEDFRDDARHVEFRRVSFEELGIPELAVLINTDHGFTSCARPPVSSSMRGR